MSVRWVTLYKYVPLKYAVDILSKNRLYLSDGKNFNDPFEVTVTDKKNCVTQRVKGLHILSLTNSFRNKLIWSHYAEAHKSICLTIQVPQHMVYPICYSTHRVYTDSDLDAIIEKSTKKCKKNVNASFASLNAEKKTAYIKDKKWIYEKEYRIVFDKDDEPGLIFEDDKWYMSVKITNVYLGVNFYENDENKKAEILEVCTRNGIKITQMELSKNDYSIRPSV